MFMSVPLMAGVLQLASTMALDSRTKTEILKSQYSVLGAQQYTFHSLVSTTTPPSSSTSTITLNGKTITTTILKLPTLPRNLPFTSREENKLLTTKVASPTTVSGNGTTTYTITIRNQYRLARYLQKVCNQSGGVPSL